mgnify:CR=1 FL=1
MLKFKPEVLEVTVIVAVAVAQVGCVMETVGAVGVLGWAFTTALVALEVHPEALRAVTLYVAFAATPVKMPVVFVYVVPSMLKLSPEVLEVTVIVAVAVAQVGWVMETVGAVGVLGWEFTTAEVALETQFDAFFAVTLYVASAATPVNTPVVLL